MKNFIYLVIGGILLIPTIVFAHPGNTDAYGCHTCRTNCSSWGLSYGEYHCHNAKALPQPEYPVTSHYGDNGTGYTTPAPNYTYTAPTTPSCPSHAYYDSLSDNCKCTSGYVANGNVCISADTYCQNQLGYGGEYSYLNNSCQCKTTYRLNDTGTSCINANTYCHNNYGYHSSANYYTNECSCDYGYIVDPDSNTCVNAENYCENLYGEGAEYISWSKRCQCESGYTFSNGLCTKEKTEINNTINYNSLLEYLNKTKQDEQNVTETKVEAVEQINISEEKSNTVLNLAEKKKEIECDNGFAPSLNKKYCVKIPDNAHQVESKTDVWLCDEGYKEIKNDCVKIEAEINSTTLNMTQKESTIPKLTTFSRIKSWFLNLFKK